MGDIGDFLQLIATFVIVVLILILAFVMTRRIGKTAIRYQNSSNMKVLERILLGQDKSLLIVQVGNKYCLIGVAQSGIQLLMELKEEDISELILQAREGATTDFRMSQFKEIFLDKFGKMKH